MPIGIVSDDEFDNELENSEVKINGNSVSIGRVQDRMRQGRVDGDNNVPESLRKIIGETSILEGRASAVELAKEFGVSESSVSAYKDAKTSTSSVDRDKKLVDHLAIVKRNASKKAGRALLRAIDSITDEKLEEAPAGVLAGIAKSLSGVVKDLEPEVRNNVPIGTQFIVFAPQVMKESSFDVIDLKE